MNPRVLERLSEMGPVAHLVALVCLFVIVLLKVWRTRREAFWPAVSTGLIGMLIGGGMLLAGVRILGLKVLDQSEFRRLERRGAWRQAGPSRQRARRGGAVSEQGKVGLVVLVRRLNDITAKDPAFLDQRQAGAVLSLLEMVLPMPGYSEQEAAEMVDDLAKRFTDSQRAIIRAAEVPGDFGLRGPRGWLANPLQSPVNRAAAMALIDRYDGVGRMVLPPQLLDL